MSEEKIITKQYLIENPDHIFVFGDNLQRFGKGGAATLRDLPNTYGFITKREPNNNDEAFYKPIEYSYIYQKEIIKLIEFIYTNSDKHFLISKFGSGLANKYKIWETVINPNIYVLEEFNNVEFLFNKEMVKRW